MSGAILPFDMVCMVAIVTLLKKVNKPVTKNRDFKKL